MTMPTEEEIPSRIYRVTWGVELPIFIFLACLANPFTLIGPFRGAAIILFLMAWGVLLKRYSFLELCLHLGSPSARIFRWVYFGVLIVTGVPWGFDSESSLLRPVRYSVHYYAYGLEEETDNEGRKHVTASKVIVKGPYRLDENPNFGGNEEVSDEINGVPLEGGNREDFFFWQASRTEEAKNSVSFPIRCFYHLLNELVSYTLPDFILMCLLLATLSFHRKMRASLRFLAAGLADHRNKPA